MLGFTVTMETFMNCSARNGSNYKTDDEVREEANMKETGSSYEGKHWKGYC